MPYFEDGQECKLCGLPIKNAGLAPFWDDPETGERDVVHQDCYDSETYPQDKVDEAIEKFRVFVLKHPDIADDLDWYAMNVGFFLCLGMPERKSRGVASYIRYDLMYWL